MARRVRKGRQINGVLLLDKPLGISSNAALQSVKRIFRAAKAGHTGSLDPLATGMLPLCLGKATRLSSFLLAADKRYRVGLRMGITTETGDAEGAVKYRHEGDIAIGAEELNDVLSRFVGQIEQVPPMYSAIKRNGKPLYELARKGVTVDRQARTVHIRSLSLIEMEGSDVVLDVHCSKGTYIRTLVESIGDVIGCGAYVTSLRRTLVSGFENQPMWTIEQLASLAEQGLDNLDQQLIEIPDVMSHLPRITLNQESSFFVKRGQAVRVCHAPTSGWVRLFAASDIFLGMGVVLDDGRVAPKRMMHSE